MKHTIVAIYLKAFKIYISNIWLARHTEGIKLFGSSNFCPFVLHYNIHGWMDILFTSSKCILLL